MRTWTVTIEYSDAEGGIFDAHKAYAVRAVSAAHAEQIALDTHAGTIPSDEATAHACTPDTPEPATLADRIAEMIAARLNTDDSSTADEPPTLTFEDCTDLGPEIAALLQAVPG